MNVKAGVRRGLPWVLLAWACVLGPVAPGAAETVLDDFENIDGWSINHSDHARIEIAADEGYHGKALRVDFEIEPGGSFVLVRKAFPRIVLPKSYALKFWLRGTAPVNDFQVKLIDRADKNVWWYNQRAFTFPSEWRRVLVKDPRVQYAWGPAGPGSPRDVGFIEFAIGASAGGKGSIWIDDLVLEQRDPGNAPPPPPKVKASTAQDGQRPELVLDGNRDTMWHSGALVPDQSLEIDFQRRREFGGLVLEWDEADFATAYRVMGSDDGENWLLLYESTHGNGRRDYIYTPDAESRFVRLELQQSSRGQGYGLRSLYVLPYEMIASPNQFFETIARESAPGTYPRYFSGQQAYWTTVNGPEGGKAAILGSDGALESRAGGFSLEPFVYLRGTLVGWNQVRAGQSLEEGYLPIPSVSWEHESLSLQATVVAGARGNHRGLFARYRLTNRLDEPADARLFLAVRTFQVLPPWQNLNLVGGVTQIRDLVFDARTVWVNDQPGVIAQTPPDRFGAVSFDEGSITEAMLAGKVPPAQQVSDPSGHASGALEYALHLEPRGSADVYVVLPSRSQDAKALGEGSEGGGAEFQEQLERSRSRWKALLNRVELRVPDADGARLLDALRAAVSHILLNRDGAALQPGPRTYARGWVRDGASMVRALLQSGFVEEPREFVRWIADYLQQDGRVACCIDRRGPDLVPEHDSNGQFLFTVAEYYRFTRDIGTLADLWPAVRRAAEWISVARDTRRTEAYHDPSRTGMFGLLPESISHEGYAGRPVHSYWDDFWALRGLKDAASLAVVMGEPDYAARLARLRDEFRSDLGASLRNTITTRKIDYIPGSVELADFDPNSTAVALSPVGAQEILPQPALRRTFERYHENLMQRVHGSADWDAYTPYELRNVEAFLLLGDRDRAWDVLQATLRDQRPAGWRQWPEVIWRDPSLPRFIGDMPHAWISSIFVEAVRSLFAFEREDGALVLAAGLPSAWTAGEGTTVRRMPTHCGVLNYSVRSPDPNSCAVNVGGDLHVPPAGIVLKPPLDRPLRSVSVNGRPAELTAADSFTLREAPAEVVLGF